VNTSWTVGFQEIQVNSWLVGKLLVDQGGLCASDLFVSNVSENFPKQININNHVGILCIELGTYGVRTKVGSVL
jgi:hypothetical protein